MGVGGVEWGVWDGDDAKRPSQMGILLIKKIFKYKKGDVHEEDTDFMEEGVWRAGADKEGAARGDSGDGVGAAWRG